jgi:CDP-glucose 4,6-dehydratase
MPSRELGQYSGRSVFVTGHTGFKGSWLSIWLHELGARVTGYSLPPPTTPSNFVVSGVRDLLTAHHEADIRNPAQLQSAIRAAAPDVIFHLAAQPLVRLSYQLPRETFEVNVMGTVNVLEAVRTLGKPCVVIVVTSDKCYENREQLWGYREIDAMGGHDPYSASKGAAEIAAAAYRRSFFPPDRLAQHGVKLATARAGNVIGGGDWAHDRIVTDIVRHLTAGETVPVRNPASVRPWQHVLEPLSGYLQLAGALLATDDAEQHSTLCDAWNFGPVVGDELPVAELVDLFIRSWDENLLPNKPKSQWKDTSDPAQPHEAAVLRLSVDKAVHQLGWRPRWGIAETVRRTACWYKHFNVAPQPMMLDACRADLQAYRSIGKKLTG